LLASWNHLYYRRARNTEEKYGVPTNSIFGTHI
jgi:hypothetical protein